MFLILIIGESRSLRVDDLLKVMLLIGGIRIYPQISLILNIQRTLLMKGLFKCPLLNVMKG